MTYSAITKRKVSNLASEVFEKPAVAIKKVKGDFVGDIFKVSFEDTNVQLSILNSNKKLLTVEKDNIRSRVAALNCINMRKLSPFPKVLDINCNKDSNNYQYYFATDIPGVPFSKIKGTISKAKINEIISEMAIYLNKVGQNKGDCYGSLVDRERQFSKWSDAFYFLLDEVLLDAKNSSTELPFESEHIRKKFIAHKDLLNKASEPSLVDLELIRDHFLIDSKSESVSGIIDCGCPIYGDRFMQPVVTLLCQNINYIDCYNYGDSFSDDEKARMALYLIFFEIFNTVKRNLRGKTNPPQNHFTKIFENYRNIFDEEF